MTNLNKEIEKKFKKFCIKCFPEPIEKGEKILAISINFEEALSFILSEVVPMVRKDEQKRMLETIANAYKKTNWEKVMKEIEEKIETENKVIVFETKNE
jgi:hypothetical protein